MPIKIPPRLGHGGNFAKRVAHQHMVFFDGGPGLLRSFIAVDDRRAAFGGKSNGLLDVLRADLRPA